MEIKDVVVISLKDYERFQELEAKEKESKKDNRKKYREYKRLIEAVMYQDYETMLKYYPEGVEFKGVVYDNEYDFYTQLDHEKTFFKKTYQIREILRIRCLLKLLEDIKP